MQLEKGEDGRFFQSRHHLQKERGTKYLANIPFRKRFRKGVIHEWEDSIEKLEDFLMPNQGKISFKRLKKKRMKDDKAWEDSKAILMRIKGDSLPTRLLVGYGHVWLKVKPCIESVKQCYSCLRFGHIQLNCRSKIKRFFRCVEEFHGICKEQQKCINCGGSHPNIAKKCPIYQREAATKKVMAYKNVSCREARELVNEVANSLP
ncbi:unnamed protein product [Xylocopa violacea]|uniref:CCHC-type domain-containing protein n=1 Tax=Xylocopa violacea TaxID=135666 RepID=A0ABP1N443_XYLVO